MNKVIGCVIFLAVAIYVDTSQKPNCRREKRSYGIDIHNDTIWLYDGGRYVGRVRNLWNSPLDSLIEEDNR